jgi:RNA polymerase sigma factor (TIGR02999 family)
MPELKRHLSAEHYLEAKGVITLVYDARAHACPSDSSGERAAGHFTAVDQHGEVTELLHQWKQGDKEALHALVPLVYKELRRLAHYHLESERPDHSLQSTALVHEAYLRLAYGLPRDLHGRTHFIAVASRLMRQVLVDYARSRRANKRNAGHRVDYEELRFLPVTRDAALLALDDALNELSRIDERQGKIVEMRFFGGLSAPQISQVLGISRATVDRDWATARIWLHREISRKQ